MEIKKHNLYLIATNIIQIIVIILLITFTLVLPSIVHYKYTETPNLFSLIQQTKYYIFGNQESWLLVFSLFLWAYIWLALTTSTHFGPATDNGSVPVYKSGGVLYHYTTLAMLATSCYLEPSLPVRIYKNMGAIIASFNISAIILCFCLLINFPKTTVFHQRDSKNTISYNFFFGLQLHPYLFGVHLKQFILPRIGMMIWQILNITNLFAGICIYANTLDYGHVASVLLQGIYILKSSHLEQVLVSMMEFTHDKAGFYLIWGSLVWIPAVQGFESYLLVEHRSNMSLYQAVIIVGLGCLAIWFNYDVLRQKKLFREGVKSGKKVTIWGREAKGMVVNYVDVDTSRNKIEKETYLLISGWWGIGRKMNYFWELVATFIWSYPGNKFGFMNYLYCVSLFIVFISRAIREDRRCKTKYGDEWDKYCAIVKFRFVPLFF